MAEFEQYYGPEMERNLFRMDLVEKNPDTLGWLVEFGHKVAEELKFLDRWSSVPPGTPIPTPNGYIQSLPDLLTSPLNRARQYVKIVSKLQNAEQATQSRGKATFFL